MSKQDCPDELNIPAPSGGGGSGAVIEFYVDRNGTVIADTENSPATIGVSTRVITALSSITTPNADTLDNYTILSVQGELRVSSIWGDPEMIQSGSFGYGLRTNLVDEVSICIQSGSGGVRTFSRNAGGVHNQNSSVTASAPYRTRIVAIK